MKIVDITVSITQFHKKKMSFEATQVKFNIPEVEEKPIQFEPFKDSDNRELPKDEYSYKLMPFKEGPKVGKSRWLVSLIIKPYVYTRVKNLKGKQRWMCTFVWGIQHHILHSLAKFRPYQVL